MGKTESKKGTGFQNDIREDLKFLESAGHAHIVEVPDPFKTFGRKGGKVHGVHTDPVEVDFAGTLTGGRSIAFEAKWTKHENYFYFGKLETRGCETKRTRQRDFLQRHAQVGAVTFCFVRRALDPFGRRHRHYILPVDENGIIAEQPDSVRRSLLWEEAGRFEVPRGRFWFWHVVELFDLDIYP